MAWIMVCLSRDESRATCLVALSQGISSRRWTHRSRWLPRGERAIALGAAARQAPWANLPPPGTIGRSRALRAGRLPPASAPPYAERCDSLVEMSHSRSR